MQERIVLDENQMWSLASPVRVRVYECLALLGEATAKELAIRCDLSHQTTLFHLHQLEEVGLVVLLRKQAGSKRSIAVYGCAAARIQLPEADGDGQLPLLAKKIAVSTVRRESRRFGIAIELQGGAETSIILHAILALNEADRDTFLKLIDDALNFAKDKKSHEAPEFSFTAFGFLPPRKGEAKR